MDLNNEFNNQIKSKKYSGFVKDFGYKCKSTTGCVIKKKSAAVKKTLGRFRGPCRHSLHTACEKTTYKDACVRERVIWRWHNGRKLYRSVTNSCIKPLGYLMALPGMKFCNPSVVDPKKQNSVPIFQPFRLLSSAPGDTMHPPKNLDFPFVPLTGHKLVDDHCMPTNFDIMNDDANFAGDLKFDNGRPFTNARSIFKNASLKGSHQFPVISISQLVGGFVGSKSQVHAKNRESHKIWDIVFKKLDEFVSSKPVEKYSEHCYEFQTFSQNLFGSLCKESDAALGLAASYILADGGQSFKKASPKPNGNISKSSPSPIEITSPQVDTSVSINPTQPSHSPSNHQSTAPVNGIFNFVEHFISQSHLSNHDIVLPDPLELTRLRCSVSPTSNLEHTIGSDNLPKQPLNKDLQDNPSLVSPDAKQSYAEVAKMAHAKSKKETDYRPNRFKNSAAKHYRKVNKHYFGKNFNDSRQRCVDSSNWRDQASSSERKDLRRDHFAPAHVGDKICGERRWRSEQKCESVPTTVPRDQRRKRRDGSRHSKPWNALKTVHEVTSRPLTEASDPPESSAPPPCRPSTLETNSCQFYNPHKRTCMNWRCRQNCQKSSAKRNMRYILMDNKVRDCEDEKISDSSPSPNENRDIRVNNSFEIYITMPPSDEPSSKMSSNMVNFTRGRSNSKPSVHSLPCNASLDDCTTDVRPKDDNAVNVVTRPRSLSETTECCFEPESTANKRSSSESSESVLSVPRSRSISEESKATSLSSSSLSSSNVAEGNLRRRFSSECDSEDSFVIFEDGMDCCDDYDSTDVEDSDESSESSEDEADSTACARLSMVFCLPMQEYEAFENAQAEKLRDLNARWSIGQSCLGKKKSSPCKKVQFAEGPVLATIHPMVKWDYAYRAARCGPWEEMARDRERFKQRVERSEPILSAVLRPAHREKIRRRLDAWRDGI